MQHYRNTIGALAAASALVAGNALAGTTTTTTTTVSEAAAAIQYQLHAGYSSEYLWRGNNLGNDLVEAGLDVSTKYQDFGLSAGAWYATFNEGGEYAPGHTFTTNLTELDLYGEVNRDFGFAKLALGYIGYINDNSLRYHGYVNAYRPKRGNAQEVYVSASRDFGFVNAALTYYGEIEGDNNGYTEFALSHSFEFCPVVSLDLSTNVGFLMENSDFSAWTSKAVLNWSFAPHAKLSPFVAYSVALSDNNDSYTGSENEFVSGAMVSVSF